MPQTQSFWERSSAWIAWTTTRIFYRKNTRMTTWIDTYRAAHPEPEPLRIPERFAAAELAGIPEGPLRQCAISYLTNFYTLAAAGKGCLFLGRAGTYKTYTACAILKQIHGKARLDARFVQCPLFVNRIERARFSTDSERLIQQTCTQPVVVMDDFSQVVPNSYGAGILLEIAEARFSNQLPTLWTGNIHVSRKSYNDIVATLTNLYGPSLGRRVAEPNKEHGVLLT